MRKIVLACAAGMSTSMLMQSMRAAAQEIGYECTVDAYPVADVSDAAKDADIVLLGPQIRFQADKIASSVACPVEGIDTMAYGTLDGMAVIKRVKEVLND